MDEEVTPVILEVEAIGMKALIPITTFFFSPEFVSESIFDK
jgi:hypothetical protein